MFEVLDVLHPIFNYEIMIGAFLISLVFLQISSKMIAGTFDILVDLELNKRECLLQGKCDLEKLYGQTCQTRLSGL